MDALQGQIKSTTNQTATMESIARITPLLNQQVQQKYILGAQHAHRISLC